MKKSKKSKEELEKLEALSQYFEEENVKAYELTSEEKIRLDRARNIVKVPPKFDSTSFALTLCFAAFVLCIVVLLLAAIFV